MLVLKTGEQTTVKIESKQADPLGNTIVCCSDGPRILEAGELENCARSWALEVRKGSTVGKWLDRLLETGSTRYRLVRGLGESFKQCIRPKPIPFARFLWWMDYILHELNSFFLAQHREVNDLKVWLRLVWNKNGVAISEMMRTLEKEVWLEMESYLEGAPWRSTPSADYADSTLVSEQT
ncbi:hypothetical protein QBC46DRAFT_400121 [Diplogelasinospora grovesii]|uniref:Uncharacterized protein n=1 Tax=Diplogelasinospora grovesii TaxID=303347 RepID=A0AAN6MVN0_9PEZI|nr:hypothetical protein QBC46DRAFT_400121 [Diplogelasinospora grovesii]